jgi:ArsR family metal-binding transcriptional regulator
MNTYEINLNAITDELVENYSRLLHNDVCIADAYRDEATEYFEGTVSLFVITGRIKDNEEAFNYIEALKARFSNCRKSFEESHTLEKMKNMPCDYSGFCAGTSCPQFFKCQY